jgi:chemotaxis signal transduction protein
VLGDSGRQIIVLDADQMAFGLLVEEVSGVERFDDDAVGPPPQGQQHGGGVSGVILDGGAVVLVLDPGALRGRLEP